MDDAATLPLHGRQARKTGHSARPNSYYRRFSAFFRFSTPATLLAAARFTAFDAAGAVGTTVTFESAVPSGEGDDSLALLDREVIVLVVGIVFEGDVCCSSGRTRTQ